MQGLAFIDKELFTSYIFTPFPNETADKNVLDNDPDDDPDPSTAPKFLISLTALIETLQILGLSDAAFPGTSAARQPPNFAAPGAAHAFSTTALLLDRSCTITYMRPGAPLVITLADAGVTTTCELTTYERDEAVGATGAPVFQGAGTDADADVEDVIPLQRDEIAFKTIMRASWLHSALAELDATEPSVLVVAASATRAPYLTLSAAGGAWAEATVQFGHDGGSGYNADGQLKGKSTPARASAFASGGTPYHSQHQNPNPNTPQNPTFDATPGPTVAESFTVHPPPGRAWLRARYRFVAVRKAARALAVASRVSMRIDEQGVLSLQLMIEFGKSGNSGGGGAAGGGRISGSGSGGGRRAETEASASEVSFVEFRFVPLVDVETESEGEGEEEEVMLGEDDFDDDEWD